MLLNMANISLSMAHISLNMAHISLNMAHISLNMNISDSERFTSQQITSHDQTDNDKTINSTVTNKQILFDSTSLFLHIRNFATVDRPAPIFNNIVKINPVSSGRVHKRYYGG